MGKYLLLGVCWFLPKSHLSLDWQLTLTGRRLQYPSIFNSVLVSAKTRINISIINFLRLLLNLPIFTTAFSINHFQTVYCVHNFLSPIETSYYALSDRHKDLETVSL